MRRSLLIAAASVALLASATTGAGQPVSRPARIGMLCAVTCAASGDAVLVDELKKLGWVEGSTLVLDRRAAETRYERLPQLAAELVHSKPDLIVAVSPQPTRAAKLATSDVPIVMLQVGDPVGIGLVQSLARPGGNITGVATSAPGTFITKLVQLIRELLPRARRLTALVNPANEVASRLLAAEGPSAALQLGFELHVIEVRQTGEIEGAVAAARTHGAEALMVVGDPMFHTPANRLPDLAAQAGIPAIYLPRNLARAGGLMSYSPDFDDINRRGAHLINRILRGTKPADLPIELPATYLLTINLKAAKALGLEVPPNLLARADEVIE